MNEINPSENHIVVFNDRTIRRIFVDDLWWFSIVDVIQTLTDSTNPRDYWYKMKIRVKNEDGAELSTFCRQLKLKSSDGKSYNTDCAEIEGLQPTIKLPLISEGIYQLAVKAITNDNTTKWGKTNLYVVQD